MIYTPRPPLHFRPMKATLPELTMQLERQQTRQAYFDVLRCLALGRGIETLPPTAHHERFTRALTDDAALRIPAATIFDETQPVSSVLRQLTRYALAAVPGAPVVAIGPATGADFVAQNAPIPVLQLPIASVLAEVAAIKWLIAMDKRTVDDARRGRAAVERALLLSTVKAEDAALLSATAAVPHERPAGLRAGAPVFPAASGAAADIAGAIGDAIGAVSGGAATALVAICTTGTAGQLATTGGGPDVRTDGTGSLGGVPLLTARAGPAGLVVFLDAALLAVVDEGVAIAASSNAALDFTIPPAAAPAEVVSMWQTNSISLRVARYVWWHAVPGAVAVADLGAAGS